MHVSVCVKQYNVAIKIKEKKLSFKKKSIDDSLEIKSADKVKWWKTLLLFFKSQPFCPGMPCASSAQNFAAVIFFSVLNNLFKSIT